MNTNTTYSATYHTSTGRYYQATVYLSAVTITIRYRDEENQEKEVYWLTKDLVAYHEQALGGELQYRNNRGEIERLGVRDVQLTEALKRTLSHHRLFGKAHTRLLNNVWVKLGLITGIIFLVLLGIYLWLVPILGERMAKGFSKDAEISMGEQMYQSVLQQYHVEVKKTAILNDFYKQLHYDIAYPVSITVVESNEMNAFAIPGGHIVVYDAILDRMKTPEELAALLGHEGSHIALRHSLRNIFRSMARQMFLALIVGNQAGVISEVVGNADALKGLQYSRSLETEADDNGLQLMAKNNINPQGMMRLMQMLQKESGGAEPAPFLSTHPVFKDRIKNIEDQIKQLPNVTTANDSLKTIFHSIYE
jgi:Zn-dependent protease with chaperone function